MEASKLYCADKNISKLFIELCKTFNINTKETDSIKYQILIKTLHKLRKV